MAEVIVTKDDAGKLVGMGDKGQRAWDRFVRATRELQPGDTLRVDFKIPRAPGPHKQHFKLLHALFDQQDQYVDFERFREWVQVGAGFCDIVPGPKGRPVAHARSISWERLEEADFEAHHREVVAFLRSTHCTRFLWPHLGDLKADELMNNLLAVHGE